ncbi:MAG: hypothetical protein ACI4CZ_09970 [Hominisplanchenecus sp.]
MRKPTIVSLVKINGEWVNQDDVPPEQMAEIVEKVMKRAAERIGFDATKVTNKTA